MSTTMTRRIPGRSSNPLIAAITSVTPEHLDDLDDEITATEQYLDNLRTMRQIAGVTPTPVTVLQIPPESKPVPQLPAKVEPKAEEKKPAAEPEKPKNKPGRKPGTQAPKTGMAGAVRRIVEENPEIQADVVIAKLKAQGLSCDNMGSVRACIYNTKFQLKNTAAKKTEVPSVHFTGPIHKPAPVAPPPPPAPVTKSKPMYTPLPTPSPSSNAILAGEKPEAVVGLRRKIADYVLRKGLVSQGDIIRDCNVNLEMTKAALTHEWFEEHLGKWRLTSKGKSEGIDY